MKNQIIIPDVPAPIQVSEELHQKILNWIVHFQEISPRIKIYLPTQELLDMMEKHTKESFDISDDLTEIVITDWPKLERVAFIVTYDSSLVCQEEKFEVQNTSLFLYGNDNKGVAFALDYFESNDWNGEKFDYSLGGHWEEAVLTWEFREKMIVSGLLDLQKKVPPSI